MADYVVRDTQLVSVADAIRAKGGTSAPLAFPDGFVDAVDAIPTGGGGGSVPAKEVNFRDYDGTIVHSYNPSEFAALTAMPDNPDHSGDEIPLTAQGWNWSFALAQAYVAKYGRLEVGQMYKTTDGKTHVLIHLEQGRTSPILGCCPNGTVDVDWGDGTAHDTLTGTSATSVKWTPMHEYAAPGDYDIKLTCTNTMGFFGSSSSNQYGGLLRYSTGGDVRNRVYQNAVRAVYCAAGVTNIGQYAFYSCSSLSSITIPDSMTSIEQYAFTNCYSLSSVTIPNSVTSISRSAFNNCYSLSSVTIPDSVISIGNNVFSNCYSLSSVTIPDSVTSIGSGVFSGCTRLERVSISAGISLLENSMFSNCGQFKCVIIPDSVTKISGSVFLNCNSLSNITIPDSVTSILGGSAFSGCYGLGEIHFKPMSPPSVANANNFANIPTDCKIYVPAGSLEAYTSAANYPSASTYTYIEE